MNEPDTDSYLQRFKECRLDPVGDPLSSAILKPSPYSSGFSTGEVVAKVLGWQQELAARVREIQETAEMPFSQKTEAANLLVKLAVEAASAVEDLSVSFPDVFKAVSSKKGIFPVNMPALPEDGDQIIRWLTDTLQLGTEHVLKLRGRKTFSRRTFANNLILSYIHRIKRTAIERQRLRTQYVFDLETLPEEKLTFHTPLNKVTAKEWMHVIWNLLLSDCPAPEENTRLKQFGAHKVERTRMALGKSSPKTEAANVRAGIRDDY